MKSTESAVPERDGFRGYFYQAVRPAQPCMMLLIGDEGSDFMSTAFARWLTQAQSCNALCIALRADRAEDTGLHTWPIEQVEAALHWLQARGYEKIGLMGLSMQAALALTAASLLPEISFVAALSPCDFVPWGFYQGRLGRYAHAEWPSGTSAFSWRGKQLPWQPAGLSKDAYWKLFCSEKRRCREMHSITIFDHSEEVHPIPEECFIPIEAINGALFLAGAEDDSMWASARYIRRMDARLCTTGFTHPFEVRIYPRGTHLLVPDRLLKMALSVFAGLVPRMFASGRQYPAQCRAARQDLEHRLTAALSRWEAE